MNHSEWLDEEIFVVFLKMKCPENFRNYNCTYSVCDMNIQKFQVYNTRSLIFVLNYSKRDSDVSGLCHRSSNPGSGNKRDPGNEVGVIHFHSTFSQ